MNHRELVAEIARRLPTLRKRDVQEVIAVLVELWSTELSQPDGEIHLAGLGHLYVESHTLKVTGVIRQQLAARLGSHVPQTMQRRVIRFRPSEALRAALKQEAETHE